MPEQAEGEDIDLLVVDGLAWLITAKDEEQEVLLQHDEV